MPPPKKQLAWLFKFSLWPWPGPWHNVGAGAHAAAVAWRPRGGNLLASARSRFVSPLTVATCWRSPQTPFHVPARLRSRILGLSDSLLRHDP